MQHVTGKVAVRATLVAFAMAGALSLPSAAVAQAGHVHGGAAINTLTTEEQKQGWRLLFDGHSTSGWRNYKSDSIRGWQAVDGALTRVGRGGDIITADKYADFELVLEWKLSPEGNPGNSGIFYRASEDSSAIYWNAPEMQILDDARHGDGRTPLTSTGSNYALDGVAHGHAKPVGEWNTVRIVVNGNHVEHWLNGTKVVQYELGSDEWKAKVAASKFAQHPQYGKAREGHIGLQEHGSFVAFRNIKIRPLN
jgi:hypothetical protein